jgi:hypothetical protein
MKQALYDIINNETPEFIESITKCDDIALLREKLKHAKKPNRRAIILARIENLTYLAL